MDRLNLGYSEKCIPIQGKWTYLKDFVINQEAVARRMRWKALKCLDPDFKAKDIKTYGFKTTATPSLPNHKESAYLKAFEQEFFDLPRKLKWKPFDNELQSRMRQDLEKIRQSKNHVFVPSDKTRNWYKCEKQKYEDLKRGAICEQYTQCKEEDVVEVNMEGARLASEMELDDRIECYSTQEAFVTIKDHKPSFPSKIDVRLITPSKSQLGKIMKQIFQDLNSTIRQETGLLQSTSSDFFY